MVHPAKMTMLLKSISTSATAREVLIDQGHRLTNFRRDLSKAIAGTRLLWQVSLVSSLV